LSYPTEDKIHLNFNKFHIFILGKKVVV
jgi:hypothetical protein